jgi:hypothetical protein
MIYVIISILFGISATIWIRSTLKSIDNNE